MKTIPGYLILAARAGGAERHVGDPAGLILLLADG
jgi:hypothetical protein